MAAKGILIILTIDQTHRREIKYIIMINCDYFQELPYRVRDAIEV